MKADTTPLHLLFKKEIQYVVPLYQRPYVWREDTHWAPLWDDLLSVVEQVERQEASGEDEIAPHFLGAVVLEVQRGGVRSVERRHIIDGQQRLTTLQLLLAAGADAARESGHMRSSRQLRSLVENDPDYVNEPDDAFKVWPTNIDRSAFRAVMLRPPGWTDVDPFNLVQEAYRFFRRSFAEQLEPLTSEEAGNWFANLTQGLRNHVQLVVIDLEDRDNPQVIFETLNARGTPLLAVDLVKNLLFLRTQKEGEDVESLYAQHWRHLERARWREDVRQGRLMRPRVEVFLMHWLTMKREEEVLSHQLYNTFRGFAEKTTESAAELVVELAHDAKLFEAFDRHPPGSPEHKFFRTLTVLDTSTLLPLVLALFKRAPPPERLRTALAALESWLVRRMVCGLTPKSYNRFVLDLLTIASKESPETVAAAVVERLTSVTSDTNRWPRDAEVVQALTQRRFYGRLSQARQRFVLSAIELHLRTIKSEESDLPATLTIEHIVPQSWREHWPVATPPDPVSEAERDERVQRIGNLTLVTGSLNAAASNNPWEAKRAELDRHSLLLLNRELVRNHPVEWTDEDIDERSRALARAVCEIWPGPEEPWTPDAGRDGVQPSTTAEPSAAPPPSPEELVERFAPSAAVPLVLQFVEELSYWEGVTVRVGKATADRARRIYFSRRGSPYGAFCRIFPLRGAARFRLDLEDVPFAQRAEGLAVQDPYRVRIFFDAQEAVSEALALARRSWEGAVEESE